MWAASERKTSNGGCGAHAAALTPRRVVTPVRRRFVAISAPCVSSPPSARPRTRRPRRRPRLRRSAVSGGRRGDRGADRRLARGRRQPGGGDRDHARPRLAHLLARPRRGRHPAELRLVVVGEPAGGPLRVAAPRDHRQLRHAQLRLCRLAGAAGAADAEGSRGPARARARAVLRRLRRHLHAGGTPRGDPPRPRGRRRRRRRPCAHRGGARRAGAQRLRGRAWRG